MKFVLVISILIVAVAAMDRLSPLITARFRQNLTERSQPMATDTSRREPNVPKPDWKLPGILDVQIRQIPFEAPKRRYFESKLAKYNEAIEFMVKTDGAIPTRALSPVLYVGEVTVIEGQRVEENVYRFLAFELDQLEEGTPISLGWPGQPPEQRQETEFRYELPGYEQKEK
jgi:hypothetical protein